MGEKPDLRTLSGREWVARLVDDPSLADRCDWSRLDSCDIAYILRRQSHLSGLSDYWVRFMRRDLQLLCKPNFEFAGRCDWEKIREYCWAKSKTETGMRFRVKGVATAMDS